jgi:hypothetical protein
MAALVEGPASASPIRAQPQATDVPFHAVAVRQRGPIRFTLETWYGDATHQRTDSQVTLDSGEALSIGTVVNGADLWDYRVEAAGTHVVHLTTGTWPEGRVLFTPGVPADSLRSYGATGCGVRWSSDASVIAGRPAQAVTVAPSEQCDAGQFEIPNGVLVYNNVNYYGVRTGTADKRAPGPMTVWLDDETGVVLAANRTTADGVAWDSFRVLAIDYDVAVTAGHLQYSPPPDAILVTDPEP